MFPLATVDSPMSSVRTRGRTVSVAFELSDDEEPAPIPKKHKSAKENDTYSITSEKPTDISELSNNEDEAQIVTQKQTNKNGKDVVKKTVTVGDSKDLTAQSYAITAERVTKSHIICVYKVRQNEVNTIHHRQIVL